MHACVKAWSCPHCIPCLSFPFPFFLLLFFLFSYFDGSQIRKARNPRLSFVTWKTSEVNPPCPPPGDEYMLGLEKFVMFVFSVIRYEGRFLIGGNQCDCCTTTEGRSMVSKLVRYSKYYLGM